MDCRNCRYWSKKKKECSTNNSAQLKICDIMCAAELFLEKRNEITEEELIERMYDELKDYIRFHITKDFES